MKEIFGQATALVRLRGYQAKKIFYELNNYAIFLSLFFIAGIFYSYYVHKDQAASQKLYLVCGLLMLYIHLQRKDKNFVFTHLPYGRLAMSIEYLTYVFPFIALSLLFQRWIALSLLLSWLLIVPYIPYAAYSRTYLPIIRWIPYIYFEWRSGLRRNFIPFVILYIVAWAFSWFKIFPLFLLWFLTTIALTFYDDNEGLEIVLEENKNAKSFLFSKLINHGYLISILYMPILVINTIFNFDYIWINIVFIITQYVLIAFAIFNKYKHYVPHIKIVSNSHFTAIITIMSALPGFFIIPLCMLFYLYPKAINHLNQYFDHD